MYFSAAAAPTTAPFETSATLASSSRFLSLDFMSPSPRSACLWGRCGGDVASPQAPTPKVSHPTSLASRLHDHSAEKNGEKLCRSLSSSSSSSSQLLGNQIAKVRESPVQWKIGPNLNFFAVQGIFPNCSRAAAVLHPGLNSLSCNYPPTREPETYGHCHVKVKKSHIFQNHVEFWIQSTS